MKKKPMRPPQSDGVSLGELFAAVLHLDRRLEGLEQVLAFGAGPAARSLEASKQWYTTGELASAMKVSRYTVQVHWCAGGRIECEKDAGSGRWRIPGREYQRLVRGGGLRPRVNKQKEKR